MSGSPRGPPLLSHPSGMVVSRSSAGVTAFLHIPFLWEEAVVRATTGSVTELPAKGAARPRRVTRHLSSSVLTFEVRPDVRRSRRAAAAPGDHEGTKS